ncbi:MAG: hypothetical protein V5786_08095 [Psychromonas sp.]
MSFIKLIKYFAHPSVKPQGFVVLTFTVLLCFACILFTTYMASSQLLDNQIIANYYRNKQAFANTESGINFLLDQLGDPVATQLLVANLPTTYTNIVHHYTVKVEEINPRKLAITAHGTSADGSAEQEINLEVDFYLHFPTPVAAVSVNGKLNLDDSALINDGCEGLEARDCQANANVADNMLVSNPSLEVEKTDACSGESVGVNLIADGVFKGNSSTKVITKIATEEGLERDDWGQTNIPIGSEVAGLTPDDTLDASSLFEATFSLAINEDNLYAFWDQSLKIDMTNGGDCSEELGQVSNEDHIIFIKGDCHISEFYAQQSKTSEHKIFTIGTVDSPKLVFIKGGTFITDSNTGISVLGMVYFLPAMQNLVDESGYLVDENGDFLASQQEAIQVLDLSIDMGDINVNGALLSEYKCSFSGDDKVVQNGTQQYFSARFDKLILETLYENLGFKATASGYRLVVGTWRDF